MTSRKPQPRVNDPLRASRIAKAALEVIKENGLTGLTHRAVAAKANVPLGSTTYYFTDLRALLAAAIRVVIEEYEIIIGDWAVGLNADNLPAKLAALLDAQLRPGSPRSQTLVEFELYLASARSQGLRPLSRQWDSVLRDVLNERVGKTAGRAYFAAYNGYLLESVVDGEPLDVVEIERLLGLIEIL